MKLYIITENSIEYNDEYHYAPESGGGTPIAAFRKKENAQAECDRRTGEEMRKNSYEFENGKPELFSVTEVEVGDNDIVSYSSTLEQKKAAKEQSAKLAKDHLSSKLAEIFEKTPELVAVKWTQYTPHFNDGDACEFSVHGSYVRFYDMDEDEGDHDDGFQDRYKLEGEREKVAIEIEEIIEAMDADDMEATFGDHVEVIAKRDGGFDVEKYSHD